MWVLQGLGRGMVVETPQGSVLPDREGCLHVQALGALQVVQGEKLPKYTVVSVGIARRCFICEGHPWDSVNSKQTLEI